jgi:hypothetical protein
MRRLAILAAIAAISFDIHSAIADEVPTYDVRKTCKADVQAYPTAGNVDGCLRDEQNARTTLVSQWTQFAADNRTRCSRMVGDPAGPQSYVELLTCLQMARDVKTVPKN